MAQAKTGTGKTLAFLVPIFQQILNKEPHLAERGRTTATPGDTRALILSPTRELAEQIAAEAQKLAGRTGLVIQTAVGGTGKRNMYYQMQRRGCHVLIGTPGRLNDILSDPSVGISCPKLKALVLDEADRLLDEGFWPQIEQIKSELPDVRDQDRQTLMFSATIPKQVVHVVESTLKHGFDFIKTVDDNELPTHARVKQKLVPVVALENMIPSLYELITREVESRQGTDKPFKAIVYFNTTAETDYADSAFYNIGRTTRKMPRFYSIHGKLSQMGRTDAARYFRSSESGILLSSDVTARGMDFPDVTHVIQMGLPREQDTYVHRLGRTARAGKEGEGWLFVSPLEQHEVRHRLRGIPLQNDKSLVTAQVDMSQGAEIPESVATLLTKVTDALRQVRQRDKESYFRSQLGAFNWVPDKQMLVDALVRLSRYGWGLAEVPYVPRALALKLGMDRTVGLNHTSSLSSDREIGGRSGDRGFGGRFGGGRDGGRDGGRGGGRFGGSGFGGGRGGGYGGGGGRDRYGGGSRYGSGRGDDGGRYSRTGRSSY